MATASSQSDKAESIASWQTSVKLSISISINSWLSNFCCLIASFGYDANHNYITTSS